MLFTAHTWRPAMCLVFFLSGTASTASAFLSRELPRFGVESRCFTTCFLGGAAGCGLCTTVGPSTFSMGTRSAWRVEVPSPTGMVYLKSSFRHHWWGGSVAGTCLLARADFGSCSCHSCCCCCILSLEDRLEAFIAPWSSTLIPDVVPGDVTSSWLCHSLIDTRGS